MKDKNRIFIFALILSLILSAGTVMATDNITFDQSELEDTQIIDEFNTTKYGKWNKLW